MLFAVGSTQAALSAFQTLSRFRDVFANELIEPLMIEFDGVGVGAAVVSCLFFVSTSSLFVQGRLRGIPLLRQPLSCVEYSLVGLSLDFLLGWLAWYVSSL